MFLKIFHFYFRNGTLRYTPEVYKNQPGRIEDYEPGRSSIAEKEAKEVCKSMLLKKYSIPLPPYFFF